MEVPRKRRVVVLVDGEHQPAAVRAALRALVDVGDEPALVVYLGGSEKVDEAGTPPALGHPAVWPADPARELPRLLAEVAPDAVIDRTADPVVDDRRRARLIAVTLRAGIDFEAAGARFTPPPRPRLSSHPTVSVVATGKRTGKTAVSGALARHAAHRRRPVVVAMGRGGPPDPVVIPAGQDLTVAHLVEVATNGGHAASDFYEDAVMTGVATIGCRRVGEGPSGEVAFSNVPEGVAAAEQLDIDLVVLEGSGAAIPPCHADASLLIVPATADPRSLHAMLPLRFLLADLLVVTLADPRHVAAAQVAGVLRAIDDLTHELPGHDGERVPELGIVVTRFRPTPLRDIAGARVLVATTAPEAIGEGLRADLTAAGAEVVGVTHALSDRARLRPELATAPPYDLLLTELKAAAVDVAAQAATERGAEVVFYDNRPEVVEAPPVPGVRRPSSLAAAFDALIGTADRRHDGRPPASPTVSGATSGP